MASNHSNGEIDFDSQNSVKEKMTEEIVKEEDYKEIVLHGIDIVANLQNQSEAQVQDGRNLIPHKKTHKRGKCNDDFLDDTKLNLQVPSVHKNKKLGPKLKRKCQKCNRTFLYRNIDRHEKVRRLAAVVPVIIDFNQICELF